MQTIVDGLVNVFLAVTVREGDVSPARHDRHKTSICTLTLKCVQWDDLEKVVLIDTHSHLLNAADTSQVLHVEQVNLQNMTSRQRHASQLFPDRCRYVQIERFLGAYGDT
ncbi:hypothetical protein NP493_1337g00003 [Ridgeia piscesae]|uniref:Uncharacterized protein n=1 Tax=Ridgeia piscesae TaxID=27915 RepID=A0AAD9ND80_RIDPI|nr:hypothetical protein NP493_1337g00003 [Ridgeia piscesae]